jgi:hypothetical protein
MTYIFLRFAADETTLAVVAGPTLPLELLRQGGVVGPENNKIKNIHI